MGQRMKDRPGCADFFRMHVPLHTFLGEFKQLYKEQAEEFSIFDSEALAY